MADSVQRTLSRVDPILGKAMRLLGPCTLKRGRGSPYEALLSAIVHQQIHGSAAAAILGRFRALYGGAYPTPAQLLAQSDEGLRACGLSADRAAAGFSRRAAARRCPSASRS